MTGAIAIGIGCTSDASCEAILHVISAALAQIPEGQARSRLALRGLYSHERKAQHLGLQDAAEALGLRLQCFSARELKSCESRLVTPSARVAALIGVASVAEAAALLGAGESARLLVPKLSARGVSCAIAGEPA